MPDENVLYKMMKWEAPLWLLIILKMLKVLF